MSIRTRQPISQLLGTSIVAFVCVVAIGLLQFPQLANLQRQATTPNVETLRQQLDAQEVQLNLLEKVPTFGFDNLIADWTFLNFLQYFGDEPAREQTDYSLSAEFFDVILARNPRFLAAYTFLSTSTALYAGQPERSVELMNQGLQSLNPTVPAGSFFVWRNKGIDELLFLGDAQAARRSFETAAEWARQSTVMGSAEVAALSQQTAQFLANNPDSKTAQVSAWAMVLENAPDNRTRRTAVDRIRVLGGDVVLGPNGGIQIIPPSSD